MQEPISAYRQIEIEVDLGDGKVLPVLVPFDVQLLMRAEETLQKAMQRSWWRLKATDKSVVEAFMDFCRFYLPESIDYSKVDPTFPALFFSRVRAELNRSFDACLHSTSYTDDSPRATDERKTLVE